jgi:hypothetical protein
MTNEELLVATAVGSWKQIIGRADSVIAKYTDEELDRRIAPGRNRVRYLVGHLVAVDDKLLPGLGIGERLYANLDAAYLTNPDGTLPDPVSTEELKKAWVEVHSKLTAAFEQMTAAQWLERHTAVSEEDFAKEPLRNRLAMLLSRTNHVSMHLGQALLAK